MGNSMLHKGLRRIVGVKCICLIIIFYIHVQLYAYAFLVSQFFLSAIFARQDDIKADIMLPGVDEPSLNVSINLMKSADSANILRKALIETP